MENLQLYVIRHGESENNAKGLWTGWYDAPLTDRGRANALQTRALLAGKHFDKVYTSDMVRARETAELAIPGCRYEASALLREIDVGTIACRPWSVLTEEQKNEANRIGYAAYGGETKDEFLARMHRFLDTVKAENCENVAVFTHAAWLLELLNLAIGVRLSRQNVCCSNCTLLILEHKDGFWRLHSWINPDRQNQADKNEGF